MYLDIPIGVIERLIIGCKWIDKTSSRENSSCFNFEDSFNNFVKTCCDNCKTSLFCSNNKFWKINLKALPSIHFLVEMSSIDKNAINVFKTDLRTFVIECLKNGYSLGIKFLKEYSSFSEASVLISSITSG